MRLLAIFGIALVWFGVLTCVARDRAHPEETAESRLASTEQDVLMLGPLEPIRLRLLIEIDGVPFRTAWRNVFDRLFDQFDVDHDGRLTAEQAGQVAAIFVREASLVPTEKSAKPQMMGNDTVTRDDLRNQIERSAASLTLRQRLSSGGAGPALIPLLDTDGDRRLSRAELDAAEQSLHCRDFNDDQLIIEQELLAGPTLSSSGNAEENGVGNGSVILLNKSLDAGAVAEILLARYDRNRDGVLSLVTPAEILSTEGRLAALDKDGNQSLDRAELKGFLEIPLDAVLPLNLGSSSGAGPKKAEALPQYRMRRKLDGGYRISFGSSDIDFRRNNRDPSQDNARPRLSDFDPDTNKYLDETEFMNVPDHPAFAVVDADRDGKLTDAEFDAFFLNRARATAAQLVLEVSDQGSDLFTALDRNFDRVLTPRELHLASKILETEDRDGDGFLGGVEMSYNLVLELSRGGSRPPTTNGLVGMRVSGEPQVKADRTGPNWFTKMDRNRDGDVSLSEFAGSRAAFSKLDQDADGLISITEAGAASEKAR